MIGPPSLLLSIAAIGFVTAPALTAQSVEAPVVESTVVQAGAIPIEYFQFGASGLPVVWIQDHHDMFRASTFDRESAEGWVGLMRRFADSYRLIAPVRRGWGASGDPGYGFDVATQAEDVLALLDALEIDRAVFIGRTIATQEVMWIAEHHPERAIATVFLGTPFTTGTDKRVPSSPAVDEWTLMYNRACDVGAGEEADRRLTPRNSYRAHFYEESGRTIDVPALLVLQGVNDREGMNLRRLDWVEAGQVDRRCDPETQAWFDALGQDPERLAELRAIFRQEATALEDVRGAMSEAFGDNLTLVSEWGGGGAGFAGVVEPILVFLDGLEGR